MAYLLDTNILVRLANTTDARNPVAAYAVAELHRLGEALHVTPQNLIEFWNVATRPVSVNGLGMSATETEQKVSDFENEFPLLPDTPGVYSVWKALVHAVGVMGKRVHDARLVAICHVHGITHLLTFNVADFTPLVGFGPGLMVVDPATV